MPWNLFKHFLLEETNGSDSTGVSSGVSSGQSGNGSGSQDASSGDQLFSGSTSGTGSGNGSGNSGSDRVGTVGGKAGTTGNGSVGSGTSGTGQSGSGSAAGEERKSSDATAVRTWKDELPEDLRNDKFISKYETPAALAKGYRELEKMLGGEKMPVPAKGATLSQMKETFQRLGMPIDIKDYKVELDQSTPAVDKEFMQKFQEQAFNLNMLPEQSKQIAQWFAKVNEDSYKAQVQQATEKVTAEINGLRKEWGEAYDEQIGKAKAALREFFSPEDQEIVRQMGLGNSATFIKAMAKVGATLDEGKIKGDGGQSTGKLTPEQAELEMKSMRTDTNGPYFNKSHPDHLQAKQRMQELTQMRFPGDAKPTTSKGNGFIPNTRKKA